MTRTRIKFCGLTRVEDVERACALGVDAVGFVCYARSPRYVPPSRLASLARSLTPFVTPVLLFVDADAAQIDEAREHVPDALLQFHGSESPVDCERHRRPYLRAVALGEGVDLLDWQRRFATARALLVDTPTPGHGGSGRTFDWTRIPGRGARTRPLVLAGGLTAGNVGAAIAAVRPDAVDVSSGVESERGVKSEALMRDFVAAVREADRAAPDSAGDA
ncbi:MAG TPA: phosphoribosylanthranilate isomerase [Burkholderiaceae bacterium]|nr:phosphoribosylanthranilate isomerase [Burkholderiaceae bacterium]